MKIKSILLTLLLSQNVFSTTVEEADKLYKKRGEKDINSYLAAQAYLKLAADETNTLEKAKLYNKSSRSFYYIKKIYFFNKTLSFMKILWKKIKVKKWLQLVQVFIKIYFLLVNNIFNSTNELTI